MMAVSTTSLFFGISTVMFLRLFSRAPRTVILPWAKTSVMVASRGSE